MSSGAQRPSKALSVESIAYSHGLFCASHPRMVIALVGFVIIICSLPFFVTSSGDLNSPKAWKTQWLNYRTPTTIATGGPQWIYNEPSQPSPRAPSWFVGLPVAVIQQVYVRLEVDCSRGNELCDKSQYSRIKMAAAHLSNLIKDSMEVCESSLHPAVSSLSQDLTLATPPGFLSPSLDYLTNNWDSNSTLGLHSLKELLYGGFWEEEHKLSAATDIPSVFGLTFILRLGNSESLGSLSRCVEALQSQWGKPEEHTGNVIQHFYFEPAWRVRDFAPLIVVYSIVFLYISFSVGKIDLVKSKIGLGFTACITVVASLTMSLGICTFFGVSISLSGSEIYPYVVITIGLENILIIVKAVISTPEELEVKYRIAVGLSKEGWAILRNLLTLLTMISLSMLVFNHAMREFCVIALVGVLCDSFLQLVFFLTVLSVDLRRLELTDLRAQSVVDGAPDKSGEGRPCPSSFVFNTPNKWRSKRVKFFYFLARCRPVSTLLMVGFSIVLLVWFSNTETFHNMVDSLREAPPTSSPDLSLPATGELFPPPNLQDISDNVTLPGAGKLLDNPLASPHSDTLLTGDVFVRRVSNTSMMGLWRDLVTTHWPRLLNYAGFTVDGSFLTVLSPITLSFHLGFPTPPTPHPQEERSWVQVLLHPYVLRVGSLVMLGTCALLYVAVLIKSSRQRHHLSVKSVIMKKHSSRAVSMKGHKQDIDCLCVDGGLLVSSSLDGELRIWDPMPNGRHCLRTIVRSELCGEPLPNSPATDTSNRLAADGEEEPPPASTPTLKAQGTSQAAAPLPVKASQFGAPVYSQRHANNPQNLLLTQQTSPSPGAPRHSSYHPSPLPSPPVSAPLLYFPQTTTHVSYPSNVRLVTATRVTPTAQLVPHTTGVQTVAVAQHSLSATSTHLQHTTNTNLHTSGTDQGHQSRRRSHSQTLTNVNPTSTQRSERHSLPHVCLEFPISGIPQPMPVQAVHAASGYTSNNHYPSPHEHSLNNYSIGASTQHYPSTVALPSHRNTQVPLEPPVISTSRPPSITSANDSLSSTTYNRQVSVCCSEQSIRNSLTTSQQSTRQSFVPSSQPSVRKSSLTTSSQKSTRQNSQATCSFQQPTQETSSTSSSQSVQAGNNFAPIKRGHVRNRSLGSDIPIKGRPGHTRNRSLGSAPFLPPRTPFTRRKSVGNISLGSMNSFQFDTPAQTPNPETGYDFAAHFNVFSQYTANLALQYFSLPTGGSSEPEPRVPPVWCMEVWNRVIAVGCGNGQIEAWNADTGSLIFCLNLGSVGICTIAINSQGIYTGHMDGAINSVSHKGLLGRSSHLHCEPVSVLLCCGDKVVAGGCDSVVSVMRAVDLDHVHTLHSHYGSIRDIVHIEGPTNGCVSGCGEGLVLHWDTGSGVLLHDYGSYSGGVIKLGWTGLFTLALFPDCLRVWDCITGELKKTIALGGLCNTFAVMGSRYFVTSFKSNLVIYDIESGCKHSEKPLQPDKSVALVSTILPIDQATVVCSIAKDLQIIPCNVKLKVD